jgi:hypothetical protein
MEIAVNRKMRTALVLLSIAIAFFVGIVARFWWMR